MFPHDFSTNLHFLRQHNAIQMFPHAPPPIPNLLFHRMSPAFHHSPKRITNWSKRNCLQDAAIPFILGDLR